MSDGVSGLIWFQSVCKGYEQATLVGNKLNTHADLSSSRARGLNFYLSLHLHLHLSSCNANSNANSKDFRRVCVFS